MKQKKELIKNTIIILVGKISTQFLSFFLLPLYTSILSSSEYGIVDIITTYIGLIVPIITLQLEMGLFRELIDARTDDNEKKKIISSGIMSVIIQFILCSIIFFFVQLIIEIPYTNYIYFSVLATMLSNLFLQISRGFGDNIAYSIGCVIAGISTILLNLLFLVILDFRVEGMLLSTAISNLLAAIYLFIKNKLYLFIEIKKVNTKVIKKLLKYSIPLVPNGLIWWIINVSDRTIITLFMGSGANGIYAVANKFSTILIQIYNVFNLSWTESASVHINDKDRNNFFTDTLNNTINIFFSFSILLLSCLPLIFKILVNKEFYEAYVYIPLLLLGMMFNIIVSFVGAIYVGKKLTQEVSKTSFWSGILNIIINLLLVKWLGIYAAAISTILAFFIMTIYRLNDVQKYVELKLDMKKTFIYCFLFLVTCISYYINNQLLNIINLITMCIVLIYFNRNILKFIKKNKTF